MKLSIIIVSYNEAEFLPECLDSILSQNLDFEYEVIIGDDGSSDNTFEVIEEYKNKIKNLSFFVQEREANLTRENVVPSVRVSNTILRSMRLAKGEYINIVSADDKFISNDYFRNAVSFLDLNKQYSAYATNFYWSYPDGTQKENEFSPISNFSFWYQYLHISCYVFKNLIDDNVLIDNFFDDCGMQFSIGLNGKIKYSEEITFSYRQRDNSIMHDHNREELDIIEMLLFQFCLNKKLPSLSKLHSYVELQKLTYRHFSYSFNELYKKIGTIDALCYGKYITISQDKKNDIVGSLLNPDASSSKRLLKKVSRKVKRYRTYFDRIFPDASIRNLKVEKNLPNGYRIEKCSIKLNFDIVHLFFSEIYMKGWTFYEKEKCECAVGFPGKIYFPVMSCRDDIKKIFGLQDSMCGFEAVIPTCIRTFNFYLINHDKKVVYQQLVSFSFFRKIKTKNWSDIREVVQMKNIIKKVRDKLFVNPIKSLIMEEKEALCQNLLDLKVLLKENNEDILKKITQLETRLLIAETQAHYRIVCQNILNRISNGEKLRFASYVVYDTTFGAHKICELMLKEPDKYDVKFVICPDIYRDMDGLKQYHKTKDFFIERYGAESVLDGYDEQTGDFLDHSDKFDIVYMANKYDVLVNKVHGIHYLCKQDVLPIHLNYGFRSTKWSLTTDEEKVDSCLYYKYFINSFTEKKEISACRISVCDNLAVSGYPKMDALAAIPEVKNKRKKILLAPHHTVKGMPGTLHLSNFLEHSDLILELPDLYPDIDFVFRPHPLLFTNLVMHGIWTQEQVDEYLENIKSKNIIYSTEADYFHLYRECDAIIHDCGSFMTEWLFTGKPCCYVIDSDNGMKKICSQLSEEGKLAFSKHCTADSKQGILNFIDKVATEKFEVKVDSDIKESIMVNYPDASEYVFENLLK